MGMYLWWMSASVGGYQKQNSEAINADFARPISGVFECALTEVSGTSAYCYMNDPNYGTIDLPWGQIPAGHHTVGSWQAVFRFRAVAGVVSHRNRSDRGVVAARVLIHDTSETSFSPSVHLVQPGKPSFTSYAYEPETGAVIHAERFYNAGEKALGELKKGSGEDHVAGWIREQRGAKLRFNIASTDDHRIRPGHDIPVFDLRKKTIVAAPALAKSAANRRKSPK